ncbi:MAG: RNA methyltransferase [Ruminococcaceae bacterium]|nr:RNA methyltransferase [Oscillospiraceae bacterium]
MLKKEIEKFTDSNVFEGMTSISALINSIISGKNDRRIIKILFDEGKLSSKKKEFGFLSAKARELEYSLEVCSADTISEYTIGNTHGGIIAICGDRIIQNLSVEKIKTDGVYFMLEGVEDPYNFGNAVRSLYASGADGIIVGERNWMGAAGVVARSSAGTSELIDMYRTASAENAVELFKSIGYTVVCAGIRDSVDIFEAELKKPLFVIIGGEKRGISRAVLDMADTIVRIEYGNEFRGSLSASACAAVFGFEISRKNRIL